MKRLLHLLLMLAALTTAERVAAQYYSWGSDAPTLRWSELRTDSVRVIYPDTAGGLARRTLRCIESVRPYIAYGFRHPALKIPFVLHAENFRSNGLVMWLPKRVEFLTTPSIDSYSMPWYKQLTAHEYRHAVQYNNLNRGTIRFLSYVLGQQGSTVGLLFLPLWLLEGDAVLSETSMSSYGRGLQPRFTLEYRAMGDFYRTRRNPDKWFCGSYRDFVPDHYQLGYQIASYSYTRYGENIWDKVAWYGARNPYLLFTVPKSLGKFYGTSVPRLFRETFADLRRFWDSLPEVANSTRSVTPLPAGNYTSYTYPVEVNDTLVVAVKSDLQRPARLVAVDPATGRERHLAYIGSLSTRPDAGGGRIWWTEYRRSLLFEERVGSRLCYLDPGMRRPRTASRARNVLYPTVCGDRLAWVEYAPDGRYTVAREFADGTRRYPLPPYIEIHGLAWDDAYDDLCFIATDDEGMWFGAIDTHGRMSRLTRGAYITLSDLRARDGKLYYGSIASGKDEAHLFDRASGREYRLTCSAYGSFGPYPRLRGGIVATTYSARGYALSVQERPEMIPVATSQLPVNLVNPPRKQWQLINLDTVRFTAADSLRSHERHPSRRYRKALHAVHIHSWTPVAFDPFDAVDEQRVHLNWGATLLSQNLLSNTEAFFSWGWNRDEGSLLKAGIRYSGLGVRFDADASYGGDRLIYSLRQRDPSTDKYVDQGAPAPEKYWSVGLTATLPLYFERGYHSRGLNLSASWNYSNGLVADLGSIRYDPTTHAIANLKEVGYREGLHKLVFSASFSDQVRLALRDFLPRWGYTLACSYTLNPTDRDFSDLAAAYARIYLPGLARHHSLSAAFTYQSSLGGYRTPEGRRMLTYNSSYLIPEGYASSDIASDRYRAFALDYQLPVWYPEGGIPGVLYIKRIRLNAGVCYAWFRELQGVAHEAGMLLKSQTRHIGSYGGDLIFDINVLRQPASATSTVRISVYKPEGRSVWVSAGVGLPF